MLHLFICAYNYLCVFSRFNRDISYLQSFIDLSFMSINSSSQLAAVKVTDSDKSFNRCNLNKYNYRLTEITMPFGN